MASVDTEFEVKDLSDDTVTFLLHANEETLKSYPYQFELSLTYHLSDNELSMEYRVVNHDTEEMFLSYRRTSWIYASGIFR